MAKVCLLCEKPSAARNFARALGLQERKGERAWAGRVGADEVRLVASRGSLYDDVSPKEAGHARWDAHDLPWDVASLQWRKVPQKGAKEVLGPIHRALAWADEVAIATDNDPSGNGDLLAWDIVSRAPEAPGLATRLHFADESPEEVRRAWKGRTRVPSMEADPMWRRGDFRDRFDWLTQQETRAAFAATGQVLRQGRVKSACVVLVGDQEKARADYVRTPFWEVVYTDENGNLFKRRKDPLRHGTEAEAEAELSGFGPAAVVHDGTKRSRTRPPALMDLARLSARMASKRNMGPRAVAAVYQKMYEDQLVSYPRTEDRKVTQGQLEELLPLTDRICAVVGVDPALVDHRRARSTHVGDGMAHGANRPGPRVPGSLAELDAAYGKGAADIYRELALSWLAMLSGDYVYDRQAGHIEGHEDFTGAANVPVDLGWRRVLAERLADEERAGAKDGDEGPKAVGRPLGERAEPGVKEGANPKPQAPTMEWLVRRLEERGIGTGATRNKTVADICAASAKGSPALVARKRSTLSLTDAGRVSWQVLPGTEIGDLDATSRMEGWAKEVADGADAGPYLARVAPMVERDLARMVRNAEAAGIDPAKAPGARKPRARGTWRGQEVELWPEFLGHEWTKDETRALLAGGEVRCRGLRGKERPFDAVVVMGVRRDGRPGPVLAPPFTGETAQGRAELRRAWSGHFWTQEEAQALLAGEVVEVELAPLPGAPNGSPARKVPVGIQLGDDGKARPRRLDRLRGAWRGAPCSIAAVWSGHRWTEAEAEALFAGSTVEQDFVKRDGTTYRRTVALEEGEGGRPRIGFVAGPGDLARGAWRGREVAVPRRQWGAELTEAELARLFAGEHVEVSRTSRAGSGYKKTLFLEERGGEVVVSAEAPRRGTGRPYKDGTAHIPESLFGHEFTDLEVAALLRGSSVHLSGTTKAGKDIDADMALGLDDADKRTYKLVFAGSPGKGGRKGGRSKAKRR